MPVAKATARIAPNLETVASLFKTGIWTVTLHDPNSTPELRAKVIGCCVHRTEIRERSLRVDIGKVDESGVYRGVTALAFHRCDVHCDADSVVLTSPSGGRGRPDAHIATFWHVKKQHDSITTRMTESAGIAPIHDGEETPTTRMTHDLHRGFIIRNAGVARGGAELLLSTGVRLRIEHIVESLEFIIENDVSGKHRIGKTFGTSARVIKGWVCLQLPGIVVSDVQKSESGRIVFHVGNGTFSFPAENLYVREGNALLRLDLR